MPTEGDPLVLRSSVDAWLGAAQDEFVAELSRTVEAMTLREKRVQARRAAARDSERSTDGGGDPSSPRLR